MRKQQREIPNFSFKLVNGQSTFTFVKFLCISIKFVPPESLLHCEVRYRLRATNFRQGSFKFVPGIDTNLCCCTSLNETLTKFNSKRQNCFHYPVQ